MLRTVDAHIQKCIRTRTVTELASFTAAQPDRPQPADAPVPDSRDPIAAPVPDVPTGTLDTIDALYARYRASARVEDVAGNQATADKQMPALLRAGLQAWAREQGGDFEIETGRGKGPLDARLRESLGVDTDDERHWAFRAIPATNALAVISRVRDAANSALTAGVSRRQLYLLRTGPWPSGPKTAAVVQEALERGAHVLPLEIDDLRALRALDALIKDNPEGLDEWLLARRPGHDIGLLRELPGGEPVSAAAETSDSTSSTPDTVAVPAAAPEPNRPAEAPTPQPPAHAAPSLWKAPASPAEAPQPSDEAVPETPAPPRPFTPSSPESPVPVSPTDPIAIGRGPGGMPAFIKPADLRRHTAIFAGSGSGKTVLIRRLVEECALRGVSSIVLDPNNDLARLGDAWPQPPSGWWSGDARRASEYLDSVDVVVWTPRRTDGRPLVFQPLPDFPAIRDNEQQFDQAVDAALGALERYAGIASTGPKREQQRAVMKEALRAYAKISEHPTLGGYTDYLSDWHNAGLSQIGTVDKLAPGLATTLRASMINNPLLGGAGEPVSPELLLTPAAGKRARVSVISLVGLPDEEQRQSFISQLQLALFAWVKRHPSDAPVGWLLVMDEAQQIAPSGPRTATTASTQLLASQARKYGLGLIFATQSPKGIDNKIVGNAGTQFYGRMQASAQIQAAREIAQARGGNVDGIGRLGRGQFFLATDSGMQRIQAPNCLSLHPASPPTEDEVIELAHRLAVQDPEVAART
ncbi:helicase HerA domain-containing protein [Tsukamurella soli]|uniref:helicase HerA domain-containing protein n=1 Tax=Tsukamurella soli TaxID=644556 RepID=UPI003613B392